MFKWLIAIVAMLVVCIATIFPNKSEIIYSNTNAHQISNAAQVSVDTPIEHVQYRDTLPEHLKNSSLKGTQIDGFYRVDENGNLLMSGSIKHRFEYFLSTMGEFNLEDVQKMVIEDIELNLSEPARSQAIALFDDYIGYKYALAQLEQSLSAPQGYELQDLNRMRMQLQELRDKRREYFDQETVSAFFGFDEMYDDFMLSRLEIQSNNQLSSEEKQAQILSLEDSLPENVRSMRNETQKISRVFHLTQDMKDSGASEEEIFQLNEQEFGQAAAIRLQKVQQERAKWEAKVDNFIKDKANIESNDGLSPNQKTQRINALLEGFNQTEKTRLNAYLLMNNE